MRCPIVFLLSPFLFLVLSCNKKDSIQVTNYEMKFKKDGVKDTLIPYYCAIKTNINNSSQTDFFLSARSKDNRASFDITIQVIGALVPGVYETVNGSGSYPVIADYFLDRGQAAERDYAIDNAPAYPNGDFTVTITSIDGNIVKGTFSGNYLYDRNYNESIVVTDGSFIAKKH